MTHNKNAILRKNLSTNFGPEVLKSVLYQFWGLRKRNRASR